MTAPTCRYSYWLRNEAGQYVPQPDSIFAGTALTLRSRQGALDLAAELSAMRGEKLVVERWKPGMRERQVVS